VPFNGWRRSHTSVVDDRPENCLDVVIDSKARAILEILTQVDSADAREQPGVMNRVMRLLGLKEPAGA
jgi:hypothetical protein